MAIPFRDADEVDELGAVGYFKLHANEDTRLLQGALFVVNARGEPLEFTYNRVETPNTFLWRSDDIRRHATRKLVTSLLSTCNIAPRFVMCQASEVYPELFCNDIHLSTPVCRVAPVLTAAPYAALEVRSAIEGPEPTHLFWFPGRPSDESIEHRLLSRLVTHGLLLEPFDRALTGLREVYPP